MSRSFDAKLEATIRGPMGPSLRRPDTTVIEKPGWYQVVTPSTRGTTLNEVLFSHVGEREAGEKINRRIGVPTNGCVGPWTESQVYRL
jgi:hypothetical protein